MSVNNKARRSAKQRRRSQRRHRAPSAARGPRVHQHSGGVDERAEISALARRLIAQVGADPRLAREHAERLDAVQRSVPPAVVADEVGSMLAEMLAVDVAQGWTPAGRPWLYHR